MNHPTKSPTAAAGLTATFDLALRLAHDFHRTDVRKGTAIPYLSHLLQVAGLVLEAGGDEEQAIAALLHDAVEDADTQAEAHERERRIRADLGGRVADLVLGCTDGRPDEKAEMTWKLRKRRYLEHLRDHASDDVLLVSVADKLHNARAILRDYREHRESLWRRFNGGKSGTLWYYRELVGVYRHRRPVPYVDELDDVVTALELDAVRGSRKHVLNWLDSGNFLDELNAMLRPARAVVSGDDVWQPRGWRDGDEAKLDVDFAKLTGGVFDPAALQAWWLAHPGGGANVPNWDLAATCRIDGVKGLVLVEAKAHKDELSLDGKRPPSASARSQANHDQIGAAIDEAKAALAAELPGIRISRDVAYQLSNRVAHAWRLARAGVPIVLLYLGFVDDVDMPKPFATDAAWQAGFRAHLRAVVPDPARALGRAIRIGDSHFTILVRSAPVPADQRRRRRHA